jgi:hypothetical protein
MLYIKFILRKLSLLTPSSLEQRLAPPQICALCSAIEICQISLHHLLSWTNSVPRLYLLDLHAKPGVRLPFDFAT